MPVRNRGLSDQKYEHLRVLVIRENWLGCTGLSAFNALLRLGAHGASVTEAEFVPTKWRCLSLRVLAKMIRHLSVKEFNRSLLREVDKVGPDLLLTFKGSYVLADTLRSIGRLGVTRYCFYPDISIHNHGPYLPGAIRQYDWIFSTKSFGPRDLGDLGVLNCSYLPHAFDPEVHRPRLPSARDRERYECDVSFIGGWSPGKARILEALVRLRPSIDLKVWGDRWHNLSARSPLRRFVKFKEVFGVEYATAICCSKINLGLLQDIAPGSSSGDRITSRTFHIPACGGLLLHERTEDLLAIFAENESCVCFGGAEELAEKIDGMLRDPGRRLAIASCGRELVQQEHSWDDRARAILDHYLAPIVTTGPGSSSRTK